MATPSLRTAGLNALINIIITVPVSNVYTMGMKRDKKDDEDNGGTGGGHPYSNLEKTSVLQEAR